MEEDIQAKARMWVMLSALARDLVEGLITDEEVDGFGLEPGDATTVRALATLERSRRRETSGEYRAAQRRATGLLRSLLTADQRAQLARGGRVIVTGSAGGTWRLEPGSGRTERVERHGRYHYGRSSVCYHPAGGGVPPADICVAHLLELLADEPGFVERINEHPMRRQLWDGAYLRRLYARRDEKEHIAQKPIPIMRALASICTPGGVILDPFMGSGSTVRAAKDLGLRSIGIEIEERYCEIAATRLQQEVLL